MKLMAVRRAQLANTGRSEVPLPPAPPPHPGYAPNAALHAIKRHAQEFAGPKAVAVSQSASESHFVLLRCFHCLNLENVQVKVVFSRYLDNF